MLHYENSNALIIIACDMCPMLYMFYLSLHTAKKQELKLGSEEQQRSTEKSKGIVNTTDMLNGIPNLLRIFFVPDTVTSKPQNLYLVQLYQNTGDYLYDNVAAVTVSLHHPLYAMVSDLPPSFY